MRTLTVWDAFVCMRFVCTRCFGVSKSSKKYEIRYLCIVVLSLPEVVGVSHMFHFVELKPRIFVEVFVFFNDVKSNKKCENLCHDMERFNNIWRAYAQDIENI